MPLSLRRDHAWIAAHIPHVGQMCLNEAVLDWDEKRIRLSARSHRAADNPLAVGGRLGALAAIEYAAQGVAAHGALLAGENALPRPGMLASARSVICHVERLDDIPDDLDIEAECLSADNRSQIYAFAVSASHRVLVEGRLTIVLQEKK